MAAVEHRTPQQLRRSAEIILPVLISWWTELPDLLPQLDSWDDVEVIAYVEEWAHLESKRHTVEYAATRGVLTADQQEQFDQLECLVAKYGDYVNRLLGRWVS